MYNSTQKKLRVALISFNYGHQHGYAAFLQRHPSVEIVAVGEIETASQDSFQSAQQLASDLNIPFYADYRKMMDEVSPELVSIAVFPSENPDVVIEAANRGIHIACEKPHATSLEGMKRISDVVKSKGILFSLDLPVARFTVPFIDTVNAIEAGKIGKPQIAYFLYLQPKGPLYTISEADATQAYKEKRGGGELAMFGGYGVVLLRKIFKDKIESVYAQCDSFFYDSYRNIGMEDMAAVTLKYTSGQIATIITGRTTTKSLPSTDLRLEVIGTEGVINVTRGLGIRMEVFGEYSDSSAWDKGGYGWEFSDPNPGELYINDLVQSILSGQQPTIGLEDAEEFTKFLNAAYQSAKTGYVVHI